MAYGKFPTEKTVKLISFNITLAASWELHSLQDTDLQPIS